ncbi:antibiotic biosynthesis monooxygenase [Pseudomonas syringae]|nr:antibiotic biosynthesis monooxygenase [Pseudomonas syringae]
MAIACVNTVEIHLVNTLESNFEVKVKSWVGQLQECAGCLDYTLTRSTRENSLWWLTGYWESESEMTSSFDSMPLMLLLNCLVEEGASLKFGSFVPMTAPAHDD